jgi:ribulose-phosphate 3-epimerase
MKVSVSILRNKDNFDETIKALNNTHTDFIHIDVLDNTFVPFTSFELKDFSKIKSSTPYDIHIMSTNMEFQINEAIKLKPEIITIQYEAVRRKDIDKYLNLIKENGIRAGIAINPRTSIRKIKKYFKKIDYLLVMGVYAGQGGQEFIPKTIKKLKKLMKIKHDFLVGLDGGVNYEVTKLVCDKVDILVVGSYILSSNSYEDQILKLNHLKNN